MSYSTKFTRSCSHCPAVRRVSAADSVCKPTDIFNNSCISVKKKTLADPFLVFLVVYFVVFCSYVWFFIIGVAYIRVDPVIGLGSCAQHVNNCI
jgi:hypothetical protein